MVCELAKNLRGRERWGNSRTDGGDGVGVYLEQTGPMAKSRHVQQSALEEELGRFQWPLSHHVWVGGTATALVTRNKVGSQVKRGGRVSLPPGLHICVFTWVTFMGE